MALRDFITLLRATGDDFSHGLSQTNFSGVSGGVGLKWDESVNAQWPGIRL